MAPMSQQTHAERRREDVEVRIIAQQLHRAKTCECGEPLSNDDWECPECGLTPEDIAADAEFMATAVEGILDPVGARASRAVH